VLCAASLFAANDGSSKTWNVRKDGTGDFSVIQHAVDVAADGDTILIGAGTYREQSDIRVGVTLVRLVAVGVWQEDITIKGVDRDSVIIEQEEYNNDGFGISMCYPTARNLRVEGLTVSNFREGITVVDWCTVEDVRATKCAYGVSVDEGSLMLSNSVLDSASKMGVKANSQSEYVEIRDCTFLDNERFAFQLYNTSMGVIEDVEVVGGIVGPSIVQGASAVMRRCEIRGQMSYGLDLGNRVHFEMYDNVIEGAFANIFFRSNRSLIGSRNVLRGSSRAPIFWIRPMETLDFRNNEILLGDSLFVETEGIQTGLIDLSGNWWGTVDPDFVRSWIVDAHSDSLLGHEIMFEPMLKQRVPLEKRSIGSVKARH